MLMEERPSDKLKTIYPPKTCFAAICALVKNWLSKECCKFINNYFFIIKLLHAHPQYVCNKPAMYQKDTLNTVGGVDFTKYAL